MKHKLLLTSSAALACVLAALSLGACNKNAASGQNTAANATADTGNAVADSGNAVADNGAATAGAGAPTGAIPPSTAPPPTPMPTAPAGAALPPAPPAPVASPPQTQEQYRYVGQAAAMGAAFANSPPDYAVDYQDSRPWIWRAGNGAYRVAEVVPGGMRYYYYEPGQTAPFFVQDPQYAYAFNGGGLAIVYDAHGRPLPPSAAAAQAAMAGRYLARARELYQAAQHEQHQAVYLANWQARRSMVVAQQRQWQAQQQRDAGWQAWNQAHADQQQAMWSREQAQREAYAARLANAKAEGRVQGARAAEANDQAREAAAKADDHLTAAQVQAERQHAAAERAKRKQQGAQ